jgi:hypothetical protein
MLARVDGQQRRAGSWPRRSERLWTKETRGAVRQNREGAHGHPGGAETSGKGRYQKLGRDRRRRTTAVHSVEWLNHRSHAGHEPHHVGRVCALDDPCSFIRPRTCSVTLSTDRLIATMALLAQLNGNYIRGPFLACVTLLRRCGIYSAHGQRHEHRPWDYPGYCHLGPSYPPVYSQYRYTELLPKGSRPSSVQRASNVTSGSKPAPASVGPVRA